MDLPQLHRHRLQQIHPRQEDVQLAFPNFLNHDLYILMCLHRFPPRLCLQGRRTRFHISSSLPLFRRSNQSPLFFFSLAFKFRLQLPLHVFYPNAQGSDACGCLFHRGSLKKKKKSFKSDTMANMISISVGVGIAAYGEARFDIWGVILQLSAVVFEATRLVMIQILLTSKGISLNPITSLYYVAPCCLVFLSVPWIFVEYPVLNSC